MHALLSMLIWLPIGAGLAVLLLGDRNIVAGRWLALLASVATLALSVPLWSSFRHRHRGAAVPGEAAVDSAL